MSILELTINHESVRGLDHLKIHEVAPLKKKKAETRKHHNKDPNYFKLFLLPIFVLLFLMLVAFLTVECIYEQVLTPLTFSIKKWGVAMNADGKGEWFILVFFIYLKAYLSLLKGYSKIIQITQD